MPNTCSEPILNFEECCTIGHFVYELFIYIGIKSILGKFLVNMFVCPIKYREWLDRSFQSFHWSWEGLELS